MKSESHLEEGKTEVREEEREGGKTAILLPRQVAAKAGAGRTHGCIALLLHLRGISLKPEALATLGDIRATYRNF